MDYHISKTLQDSFDNVIGRVNEELKREGFGILTEINVRETLKERLSVEFRNYQMLGTCNPAFAYRVLQAEDKVRTILPCNVIVQERDGGNVEVSEVAPIDSMHAIGNPKLGELAEQVQAKWKGVIEKL